MVGIYFSGTGNTKHCVFEFLKGCDSSATAYSTEDTRAIKAIQENDSIIFGYPIYFSNLPKIVRDFIDMNRESFANKKVFVIATMGLFSGDGTGCSARLFKKYGAKIVGGLHIKMPDCIGDAKILKKTQEQNKEIVRLGDKKILVAANKFKDGKPTKEGLNFLYHFAGLFGQRLWFFNKTKSYSNKLKIDKTKCIMCGNCASHCPMQNFKQTSGNMTTNNLCTMCYRCISNCPNKAITLLGKRVFEQCKFENYTDEG